VLIIVNGEPCEFTGTVADLLQSRCGERCPGGVAVAVDGAVVRRGDWESHPLRGGERVDVVTAVQGG
jgi:sulfur carrier protein